MNDPKKWYEGPSLQSDLKGLADFESGPRTAEKPVCTGVLVHGEFTYWHHSPTCRRCSLLKEGQIAPVQHGLSDYGILLKAMLEIYNDHMSSIKGHALPPCECDTLAQAEAALKAVGALP
jgi:hypothetical protein